MEKFVCDELLPSAFPSSRSPRIQTRIRLSGRAERILVTDADGARFAGILKWANRRESWLYEAVLSEREAPRLLASGTGPGRHGTLLLLEDLADPFPDFADPSAVSGAYRLLGALHRRFQVRRGATLLHGDFHRWNLLQRPERIVAVDWEHARFGNPVQDLTLLDLDPEAGPPWEGIPTGAMAVVALQAYHRAGPLAHLSWQALLRAQREARRDCCLRLAAQHEERARAMPAGAAREVVLDHARRERERARWVERRLRG